MHVWKPKWVVALEVNFKLWQDSHFERIQNCWNQNWEINCNFMTIQIFDWTHVLNRFKTFRKCVEKSTHFLRHFRFGKFWRKFGFHVFHQEGYKWKTKFWVSKGNNWLKIWVVSGLAKFCPTCLNKTKDTWKDKKKKKSGMWQKINLAPWVGEGCNGLCWGEWP